MSAALRRIGVAALWLLAAAGAAGGLLWLLAQLGVARPLIVVSESMRPAMRAGDLVFAVRTPVAELEQGDAVSVRLGEDERYLTHRLVAATPRPGAGWSLTLKGDANPVADPEPVLVGDHVLKVVWTAPLRLPLGDAPDAADAVLGAGLAAAEAAWTDVVHAALDLMTPVPGPAPYAIATTTAWDRIGGTSPALCPTGDIEYDWTVGGAPTGTSGGGDTPAIEATIGWNQLATLSTSARCHHDGRASDWVPATNNGVGHVRWWPYVSGTSGYTHAPSRRFEAHFTCPAWTTSAVTSIGVRRTGSWPTTALWSTSGTSLVANWSGTMGNGSVWMGVSCTGPWGVASTEAHHWFGPGCVPTITVSICTDYYRG